MMGIGFPELMVILVIIMIIFGAGKLPQIGNAFGQSIKNFKTSMKEAEALDEPTETASVPEGEQAPVTAETSATGEVAPTPPSSGTTAPPAPKPATATAQTETAKVDPNAPKKPTQSGSKACKKGEKEKTEAEKMIEDAIEELKEKRIGTIRTPHDGLVQQNDVFTGSLKKTPFGRGRDRGVRRDVI